MRTRSFAARPAMAAPMHRPVFEKNLAGAAPVHSAREVPPSFRAAGVRAGDQGTRSRSFEIGQEAACIGGVNRAVAVAVEDDSR